MVAIKLLKRRDGSSGVVAVALGFIVADFLIAFTGSLASRISLPHAPRTDWHTGYLLPAVQFVLELIALEILAWIYVWAKPRGK